MVGAPGAPRAEADPDQLTAGHRVHTSTVLLMSSRDLAIAAGALFLVVGAIVAIAIAGGDDSGPEAGTSTTSSSTSTSSTSSSSTTIVPGEVGERFTVNLAARTATGAQRIIDSARVGSPAEAYGLHQRAALTLAGPTPAARIEARTGDAIAVCDTIPAGAACRTFDDFTVDAAGMLETFTIDGRPLNELVLAGGMAGIHDDITMRVISALETSQQRLVVIVEVVNVGAGDVLVNGFAAVHRAEDGTETEASSVVGDDLARAGMTVTIALFFDGADLGGVVTVPGQSADFSDAFDVAVALATP